MFTSLFGCAASAALHKSTRIMLAAIKFFLGQDELDPDDSDAEDDDSPKVVNPTKTEVYKATKKGTVSSKKKKAAKLKRVMAAVKKQQRKTTRNFENFAAIQLLNDPQASLLRVQMAARATLPIHLVLLI